MNCSPMSVEEQICFDTMHRRSINLLSDDQIRVQKVRLWPWFRVSKGIFVDPSANHIIDFRLMESTKTEYYVPKHGVDIPGIIIRRYEIPSPRRQGDDFIGGISQSEARPRGNERTALGPCGKERKIKKN